MSGTCPFCAEALAEADTERCPHCGESLLKGSPCKVHPEHDIVATCRSCARYVCKACKVVEGGCIHCEDEGEVADAKSHYDLGEVLGAVTKDPDWVTKVLLGGVCMLTGGFLVPIFALLGYRLRIIRQQRKRPDTETLPEWDDWGDLIKEGFKIWVVEVLPVFVLVLIAMGIIGGGFAIMASTRGKGTPGMIGGIIIGGGYLFLLLEIFVFTYFLPAIEMEYLDSLDMTSGLKLRKLWRRAFSDPIDYLLFFLFHYLINSVIAPLGILLCFIGIYATAPWGMFTDGILFGRYLAKKDQAKKEAGAPEV